MGAMNSRQALFWLRLSSVRTIMSTPGSRERSPSPIASAVTRLSSIKTISKLYQEGVLKPVKEDQVKRPEAIAGYLDRVSLL